MSVAPIGNEYGNDRRDLELLRRPDNALRRGLADVLTRLDAIERSVEEARVTPQAAMQNLLRASDFDHSTLGVTSAGANDELYGWRRGCDVARPINPTTNPFWDITQGWLRVSTIDPLNDLSYPLANRPVRAGQTFYVVFNARLKAPAPAQGLRLEVGIWDKTAGIDNWLGASLSGGGSAYAVNVQKVGPGAASVSYTYKVVAQTDRGGTIVSAPATVVGASVLNSTDYNQISWNAVTGASQYRVYRTAPTQALIATIGGGSLSFNDVGVNVTLGEPVPAPTVESAQQARALLGEFGLQLRTEWQNFQAIVPVPSNYNFAATANDGQWFRFALRGLSTPPDVEIDRVGLSRSFGYWEAAREDLGVPTVIAPTNDGGQGSTGGGSPLLDWYKEYYGYDYNGGN